MQANTTALEVTEHLFTAQWLTILSSALPKVTLGTHSNLLRFSSLLGVSTTPQQGNRSMEPHVGLGGVLVVMTSTCC